MYFVTDNNLYVCARVVCVAGKLETCKHAQTHTCAYLTTTSKSYVCVWVRYRGCLAHSLPSLGSDSLAEGGLLTAVSATKHERINPVGVIISQIVLHN